MKPERKRLGGWLRKLATYEKLIALLEAELAAKTAIIEKFKLAEQPIRSKNV